METNGKDVYSSMKGRSGIHSSYSKTIGQFDIDGNLLNIYFGIRATCRKNGWNHQNLIFNLKNKTNSAYGYKWRYL